MKVKGITRKLDDLGRIVVPKEYRKHLGIKEGEHLEMIPVEDGILIKVYNKVDAKNLEDYTNEELIQELARRTNEERK